MHRMFLTLFLFAPSCLLQEIKLVCFHMWMRLVKYKLAFRRGITPPHFSTPNLTQWRALERRMVMKNVANQRCLMKADKLIQLRAVKKWVKVLYEENLDLNEHSKIAENHFIENMARKHFLAWNKVLRQRGKMNRVREKLFYVWARWAARERRLKLLREDTEEVRTWPQKLFFSLARPFFTPCH